MSMATDDERREVARRLREYVDIPDDWWADTYSGFYVEKCVFGDVERHRESELFVRLADLIDPDTTTDTTKTAEDTTKAPKSSDTTPNSHQDCGTEEALTSRVPQCDRDALLALADDVDGAADDSGGFEPLAGMLRDIARCIREACGEAEHGR